jgi:GNAT superfamily N-acetyltransferase
VPARAPRRRSRFLMSGQTASIEPALRAAERADLPDLVRFVQAYYRLEDIPFDLFRIERGLVPLLERDDLGRVWMIEVDGGVVGYVVLCFGYSVEKGGRDAMVDEFFIDEAYRRRGVGRRVLERILAEARALGVVSVFLEVERGNEAARRLYAGAGFRSRDKYLLMNVDLV